jgi:hypothetical protein
MLNDVNDPSPKVSFFLAMNQKWELQGPIGLWEKKRLSILLQCGSPIQSRQINCIVRKHKAIFPTRLATNDTVLFTGMFRVISASVVLENSAAVVHPKTTIATTEKTRAENSTTDAAKRRDARVDIIITTTVI